MSINNTNVVTNNTSNYIYLSQQNIHIVYSCMFFILGVSIVRLIILCQKIRNRNINYNRLPGSMTDSNYNINNNDDNNDINNNDINNNSKISKSIFLNEILIYNVKVINSEICCICLDSITDPVLTDGIVTTHKTIDIPIIENDLVKTQCHHIYHKKCLLQWIQYSNKCPLCKINLF